MSEGKVSALAVAIPAVVVLFIVLALALRAGGTNPREVRGYGTRAKLVSLFGGGLRHVGDTLIVRASLLDGSDPVGDATVTALLMTPNHADVRTLLADDGRAPDSARGDGVYSGTLPALSVAGEHSLYLEAAWSRPRVGHVSEHQLFYVARSRSYFNGQFRDSLLDENRDRLFDHFRLGAGVTVTDSVRLQVATYLSAGGNRMSGMVTRGVGAGDHWFDVDVSLGRLARTGYRGPFVVDSILLYEDDDRTGPYVIDRHEHAYTTEAYTIQPDTVPDPHWTKRVAAHGVDRDGNGRYESLVVELGVAGLRFPGKYYARASLSRGPWSFVGGGVYLTLPRDSATVRFEFPGRCIARARAGGRLRVTGFYLFYLESGRVSRKPHTGFHEDFIPLDQDFTAGAFDPDGPEKVATKAGGTYQCW